jgi:hypothetical protein
MDAAQRVTPGRRRKASRAGKEGMGVPPIEGRIVNSHAGIHGATMDPMNTELTSAKQRVAGAHERLGLQRVRIQTLRNRRPHVRSSSPA